jgi:glycosyltransferase involved in cell wall biosynthesis
VITEGAGRRSVATGKLFEYLATGRPILVLGRETEAARIVTETGAGTATSEADPQAIADALRSLAEGDETPKRDRAAVNRYAWPELGARYAELIESVTAG